MKLFAQHQTVFRAPFLFLILLLVRGYSVAQVPDNLVADGIPAFAPELKADVSRDLEFRSAAVQDWHPTERRLLISTRFADSMQLHLVRFPGGDRQQITFLPEPVASGSFQPKHGKYIVFLQDQGGGEFYQIYRYDLADGRIHLLTDGKSRNMGLRWAESGGLIAYTSTRRNGKDNDIYVMDPADPKSDHLVQQVEGGGWAVDDWSRDESKLLLREYISINESYIHLLDLKTGRKELVTPKASVKVAYANTRFSRDGRSIYFTSDKGSEFQRLYRMELAPRKVTMLSGQVPWDVDHFELSKDSRTIAFISNEEGVGALHLLNTANDKELPVPRLPLGIVSGLQWHENGRDLAFNLTSAKSPLDVYSLNLKSGKVERWTESEIGGLNAKAFVEPEVVRLKSFDGTAVSGFLFRPDPRRFPGKRPVVVSIHGGPEGQSRPQFQARFNYFLSELGIAVLYPNVRGSSGYGKTFLTLDNGLKREDTLKDIESFLNWIPSQPQLDSERVAVMGGSYGGYMVLACMTHFSDRLRCGVDVVGISNWLTFLKNTQDYRRDLRHAEYGDERNEEMRVFLGKISPIADVSKIKKPLLIVQGRNDPRVPYTESEQMVKALRDQGGTAWYLMAKDEGHGFAKKKNNDFQFVATILFLKEFLLK